MKNMLFSSANLGRYIRIAIVSLFAMFLYAGETNAQVKRISVYFPFGEEKIEFNERLRLLYFIEDSINNKTTYTIHIKGYCDNIDDDAFNYILSQQRADHIKEILLNNGLEIQQVKLCKGYGEKIALNKNANEEERKVNRRVDVICYPLTMSEKEITGYDIEDNTEIKVFKDSISAKDFVEGETLILDNLNFQPGRHILLPKSIPTLKQLLKAMQENPGLEIEIVGHICCEPDKTKDAYDIDTQKLDLSVNRSKEIYNYLIKNGIDETRMRYSGKGASQRLIEIEKSPQDQEMNRRVEIIVKKS
ncbi:MAG: OmpA family protein [Fimbriimonadaceae bacterium]|nr:OmpA family protein [Chitinophagales bacterium]